jgi:hypothetical protein
MQIAVMMNDFMLSVAAPKNQQTIFTTWCQCYKTFFSFSLTMRPNKLEGLPLEILSSQVLKFEGKARTNPNGGPFSCFLLV